MKVKKRILALALALLLCAAAATPALAAEGIEKVNVHWFDVEIPDDWHLRDASYVKEFGILSCWLVDEMYNYYIINIDVATGKQTDRYGDYFIHPFSCGRAMIVKTDPEELERYGYMDTAGNVVIAPEYYAARPFFDGYAAVIDDDGGYAYIDVNGKEVFTANKYSRFYDTDFRDGIAVVGSYAVIDKNLEYIVEPGVYKDIDLFYDGMAVVTDQNSKKGLINEKGEVVLACAYDQLYYDGAAELICVGNRDGNGDLKYGYVDLKGNVVIPLKYDRADPFSDGLAYVKMYQDGDRHDATYEFIDPTGKTVLDMGDKDYEEWSTEFKNGLLCVAKAVKTEYDYVSMFTLIDKSGKEVFPWVRGDTVYQYENGVFGAGDMYDNLFSALYDAEGNKIISSEDIDYAKALTEENPDEIREPEIIAVGDEKIGWFRYPEDFGKKGVAGMTDVAASDWFANAVAWAVENDIMAPATADTFAPSSLPDRGDIIEAIWRAAGRPEPADTNNPFTDVKSTDPYYKAVLWAVASGVTTGTTDTTFEPNKTVSRGEIVTFLWRAANEPEPKNSVNPFADATADWYKTAVLWAVEQEITNGTNATGATVKTFSPDRVCTKGELITFIYRSFVD